MEFGDIFKGSPSPAKWEALGKYLREGEIRGGHGVLVRQVGNKTIISAARRGESASGGGGRYQLTFDGTGQKVVVSEGSVAWAATAETDGIVRPYIPKISGVALGAGAAIAVAGKSAGIEYEVVCIYSSTAGRVVMHDPDDELDIESHERARLLGTVKLKNRAGGGLEIDELKQRWADDIEHLGDDYGSSSAGSQSGDNSDGESDGGGDSDSITPPDNSDSDDSDSDSSSSSSSGGATCPEITNLQVVLLQLENGEQCFEDPVVQQVGTVAVSCEVGPYAESCRNRLYVRFTVGATTRSIFLGSTYGAVSTQFDMPLFSCSTYTATAQIQTAAGIIAECNLTCAPVSVDFVTPGLCTDGGSCST